MNKSDLHSTIKQECVNSLMTIHVHKDETDELEFKSISNEFVAANVQGTSIFGTFFLTFLITHYTFKLYYFIHIGSAQ